MTTWYRRAKRRALLVLACVLMAAAVPAATAEPASSRPIAALVLGLSPVAARGARPEARGIHRLRPAARVNGEPLRAPVVPRPQRALGRAAPDERYLYLLHAKLLC